MLVPRTVVFVVCGGGPGIRCGPGIPSGAVIRRGAGIRRRPGIPPGIPTEPTSPSRLHGSLRGTP
eukprot:1095883-Amorphochlora_amoeboformis.AAC.1